MYIHHKDKFFIQYKDRENLNCKVYEAPLTGYADRSTWKEVIAHNKDVKIEYIDVFDKYLAAQTRKNGLNEILIMNLADGKTKTINFPEPVYTAAMTGTPEFTSATLRYRYTSLNRPNTVYDYDFAKDESDKAERTGNPRRL